MLLSPTGRHRPLRPNEKAPVRINVVLLEFFGAYLQEARLQNLDKAQNLKNDIYIYISVQRVRTYHAREYAMQKGMLFRKTEWSQVRHWSTIKQGVCGVQDNT